MFHQVKKAIIIFATCTFLFACANHSNPALQTRMQSELEQGERFFNDGYYKKAMNILLPIACEGNAKAQYAVGYMYYYGYGVAQDTDVGYFWINRAAQQGFVPAIKAKQLIDIKKAPGG